MVVSGSPLRGYAPGNSCPGVDAVDEKWGMAGPCGAVLVAVWAGSLESWMLGSEPSSVAVLSAHSRAGMFGRALGSMKGAWRVVMVV